MNTFLSVVLALAMLPVQYGQLTIRVEHVSPWGHIRPLAGAQVYVTDLGPDEKGPWVTSKLTTDAAGVVLVKIPVGHHYNWQTDPALGWVNYSVCRLQSFNAGYGEFTRAGEMLTQTVRFSGRCDAKGEM